MRQIYKAILCLALIFGLCSCGSKAPTWQEQYDLGVRYLSEGNYEEAIIAFTTAIEIDPKRAEAYAGRGDAYVLSGKTEENLAAAQKDYEMALELDETNADAYLGLADVYIRQGDYKKAMEILQKGLEKTNNNEILINEISEIETEIDSRDWALDSPIDVEELTVGGTPFYQMNIYEVKEKYSSNPLNEIYEDSSGMLEYQPSSYSLRFFQYPEHETLTVVECFLGAQCEFRQVVVGESLQTTLGKLGFTESGVRYIEKSASNKTGGIFGKQTAVKEWEKTKAQVSYYGENIPAVYWNYYTETESLVIELSWLLIDEQIQLSLDFRDNTLSSIRMTAF